MVGNKFDLKEKR
jgi:GTPase SAR1 family protein